MYLTPAETIGIILAVALGTQLTRWLTFLLFPEGRTVPKTVTYLGKYLPTAAMGLLVVYSLRNISLIAPPHGIPEAVAVAVVVLIHLWKRNTLASIAAGTAVYMLLVQTVFA